MKKEWYMCLTLIMVMALLLPSTAASAAKTEYQELRMTTVREEPVNLLSYASSGLDWLAEITARLMKSGEPSIVFKKHLAGALDVTFVEGFLLKNLNLVGGATLVNEEPVNFIWGFKWTGWTAKTGGIWEVFSELQPVVYNERGQWFLALAYEWKEQPD